MFLSIYNFFVPFFLLVARGLALFMPKLARSFTERKDVMQRWRQKMQRLPKGERIWFHVASVGEYERILPIIEYWKQQGDYQFIVSFFSPEVLRFQKDIDSIDVIEFLPFDVAKDMDELISLVKPHLIVLDRYDIWPNFVYLASLYRVPIALINASIPPLGVLGRISLFIRRSLFRRVSLWTFVDGMAAGAWNPYIRSTAKGLVTGNPRVDQALIRAENASKSGSINKELSEIWPYQRQQTIIAGSTWPADEQLLLHAFSLLRADSRFATAKIILVPHEPSAESTETILQICQKFKLGAAVYSQLQENQHNQHHSVTDVLIFDKRGYLAELYACGATAYVGGGFGKEVHSTIEPAAHHVPVAFGPRFHRSPDAKTLIYTGGARSFHSDDQSAAGLRDWWVDTLSEGAKREQIVDSINVFLTMNRGAGMRIADFLEQNYTKQKFVSQVQH